MNLIDENEEIEQEANKKKILKIIMIAIAVLVVLAIIIVIVSILKNKNTVKLNINDKSTDTSGVFLMTDDGKNINTENGNIYISVRKLASILGVEYYNNEYKSKGEDKTKCYIKTSNEYTSFISNSSQIYKTVMYEETQETGSSSNNNTASQNKTSVSSSEKIVEYEYFTIENGVRYINDEIYANQEAIRLGFNVIISYDQNNKEVSIYTLDDLETRVSKIVSSAVIGDECSYTNKKLLKYGMVLIKNTDSDGIDKYGIVNYNNYQAGNYLVSCKYSNIRFSESNSNIIVTNSDDGKQGIFKLDLVNGDKVETFIEPKYQLIRQIDTDSNLYLVKEGGKYGVISILGNDVSVVLKSEYQQIGVDHVYSNMENKYIINEKYIPVKADGKWGLVGLDGKTLIVPQYEELGCYLGEAGTGDGVIILPELVYGVDAIVVVSEINEETNAKTYLMINVQTGEKVGLPGAEIYSKYEDDETNYYLKLVDDTGNIMKVNIYDLFGKKAKSVDNEDDLTNNTTNNNTTTNNTVTDNTVTNSVSQNNTTTSSAENILIPAVNNIIQ